MFDVRKTGLILLVLSALALGGCDGDDGRDGADGQDGAQGPPGPPGPAGEDAAPDPVVIGDGSALTELEIARLGKLEATITNVTVSSPPVVDFTVTDQNGNPAEGIASGYIWFTFAKLVPNTDPDINGGLPYWQSYVNRSENVANNQPGRGSDVLDVAVQATTDSRFSGGSHEELEPGVYQYTFGTDVTNVTAPIAVPWEPNLTHRVGLEIRLDGDGEVPLAPDNAVFDFVPDGGAGSGVTKDILDTDKCNSCHYEFAFHGGPRKTMDYCVTCHNPGTVDQDSGENLDMAYMTHSIHMGEDRLFVADGVPTVDPYIIWGFSDFSHDYSHVTYPQSNTYCETCHEATAAAPDGDAWNDSSTAKTCGGCHANGLVAQNFDPVTGEAEYLFDHAAAEADGFVGVAGDGICANCHDGTISTAGDSLFIHSRISGDQRFREALGEDFVFEILSATNLGPGETPVITFRVTDAAGTPYDIVNDPEFTSGSSSLNLYVSWPGIENYNGDTLGNTGGFRDRDPVVSTPEYYGAGHPNRMYLAALQRDITANPGWVNADGSYTVTYFTSLPTDFSGSAMVALGGHPAAVGVTDADGNVGDQRAAPDSIVYYAMGAERAFGADANKCNDCHKHLQEHGSNRNGDAEMCIVCHNADLAAIEDEVEAGFGMGIMIHALHAASESWFGGYAAGVTYPQSIANCDTCHVDGTYDVARAEARSVSLGIGLDETVWTDDPATTPTSQACGTCHTSAAALGHFSTQNGQVGVAKDDVLKFGGLPNGQEACAVCHGTGAEFETSQYHNPGIAE